MLQHLTQHERLSWIGQRGKVEGGAHWFELQKTGSTSASSPITVPPAMIPSAVRTNAGSPPTPPSAAATPPVSLSSFSSEADESYSGTTMPPSPC